MASIWIGNLRDTRSLESDLEAICSRYGQLEDLWVSRAPTGPDCFAVAAFASPAAAQRAQAALAGQVLPAITERTLKVREWTERPERPSQAATWQHDAPAARQQRWADAEDEPPLPRHLPPQRQFGSGWAAAMAAAEEEDEEEEESEEEEEEDDEWDPIVELWVGNLCNEATRLSLRRAFELFGEVTSLTLHRAPYDRSLQYAMVQLPASGAERALQELNGLIVYELSGDMELIVKQSKRSLQPLQRWQQEQQRRQAAAAQRAAQRAARPDTRGPVDAEGLEVACEDGSVAPLQGPVRRIKHMFVCEGPPSRMLWVGSIGGHATVADVTALFRRYGAVHKVNLQRAPGYQNTFQFGLVEMGSAAEAERARSALQGVAEEAICDSKPLKLRYGWPPRLVLRGGRLPAAYRQQQQQQQRQGEGEEAPPGFPGGSSGSTAARPAEPRCAVCGAREPEAALKRCSACRAVHYCSQQCQLKGWEAGHHEECARLKQLSSVLEAPEQQLSVEALRLLSAALQQPGRREGRMLQALLSQQQPAEVAPAAAAGGAAPASAAAAAAEAGPAAAANAVQGNTSS